MNVKEMIKALQEQSQNAEVYYLSVDGGLVQVANIKTAIPGNDESKEIVGEEFVLIE